MDVADCIEKRRTVRKFTDRPVPFEDLKEIVRCGTLAPNGGNRQDWQVIAVYDPCLKDKMKQTVEEGLTRLMREADVDVNPFKHVLLFSRAPVLLVVLSKADFSRIGKVMSKAGMSKAEIMERMMYPSIQSASAMVQNMLLRAYSLGYGTLWTLAPLIAREELETLLEVQRPWELTLIVGLGEPASEPKAATRKPLEDVLSIR